MSDEWVEWQAQDAEARATQIGGRVAHASWPLVRFTLRSVLLEPHRRAGGGTVDWRWRGPRQASGPDAGALAELRRRLGNAISDLAAEAETSERSEVGGMEGLLEGLMRMSDHRLSSHAVRTESGWMVRSWGFDAPARASVVEGDPAETRDEEVDTTLATPSSASPTQTLRRPQSRWLAVFGLVLLGATIGAIGWWVRRDPRQAAAPEQSSRPTGSTTLAESRTSARVGDSRRAAGGNPATLDPGSGSGVTTQSMNHEWKSDGRVPARAPGFASVDRKTEPGGAVKAPGSERRMLQAGQVTRFIDIPAVASETPTARSMAAVQGTALDKATAGDVGIGGSTGGRGNGNEGGGGATDRASGPAPGNTSSLAASLSEAQSSQRRRNAPPAGLPAPVTTAAPGPSKTEGSPVKPDAPPPSRLAQSGQETAERPKKAEGAAHHSTSAGTGEAGGAAHTPSIVARSSPAGAPEETSANSAESWGHQWQKPRSRAAPTNPVEARSAEVASTTGTGETNPVAAATTARSGKDEGAPKEDAASEPGSSRNEATDPDGQAVAREKQLPPSHRVETGWAQRTFRLQVAWGKWRMLRVRDAVLRTWPSEQAAVRNIAEARAHVLAETEAMIPPGFQTVPTRSGWMVQVTSRALQSGPPAWTVEGEGVTVEVTGDRALMAWAGDLPDRDVVAGLQTADGTALVRMTIHAAARTMEIEGSGAVVAMAPQFAVLYPSPGSSGGLAWQNLATSRTGQVLKIWQDEQEIGVLCFAPEGKVCPQGAIEVGWVHGKSGWALMRTLDVVEQAPSGWILRRE